MKQKINKISIFTFINNVRVYYEDTDAGGVVYHSNYLKYAERARTEMLRKINIEQAKLKLEHNIQFIVKEIKIEFTKPAKLDQLLTLKSYLLKIAAAKIKMKQIIYKDSELLANINLTLGSVNTNGKPTRLPKFIHKKLEAVLYKEEQ